MTLPLVIPAIAPLLPALMEATQFPRSDAAMKWINLALGIVAAGVDVNMRLEHLNNTVKHWAELGQDPPQEWWDEYGTRSLEAHETIQAEAERRRQLSEPTQDSEPTPPEPESEATESQPAPPEPVPRSRKSKG